MKTTLYILTLFLLFQNVFGEDKNYFPPVDDFIFGGLCASYSKLNNHNSIYFGVKTFNNDKFKYLKNYQLNFLSFDWQRQDVYNDGNTSYSYLLSNINSLYLIALIINEEKVKKNSYIIIPFIALNGITNGKFAFTLFDVNTSKISFLNASIFAKSKLDYFIGKENNWWRWKPGIGIEFNNLVGKKIGIDGLCENGIIRLVNTYGISLELGLEKPIDFGVANPQSHKLTPYVNFILLKGF